MASRMLPVALKIVVTRPVADEALAMLRPRADVAVGPSEPPLPTADEVARMIRDADIVYTLPANPLTSDAISGAERLRMIATMGTGYDNIDVTAAKERGIPVTFAPGILDDTTADAAFALLLAKGFAMTILYHDARRNEDAEREVGATFVPQLDALLARSDFVSLHVPLLPETRHLIHAERLRRMKRTAILVNTSRGPV